MILTRLALLPASSPAYTSLSRLFKTRCNSLRKRVHPFQHLANLFLINLNASHGLHIACHCGSHLFNPRQSCIDCRICGIGVCMASLQKFQVLKPLIAQHFVDSENAQVCFFSLRSALLQLELQSLNL
jgi:hypothetical protein